MIVLQTTSQEYQDACDLWDLYEDTKNLLMAEVFGDTAAVEVASSTAETDKEVRFPLFVLVYPHVKIVGGTSQELAMTERHNIPK